MHIYIYIYKYVSMKVGMYVKSVSDKYVSDNSCDKYDNSVFELYH